MDFNQLSKMGSSWLVRIVLLFLIIGYVVIGVTISSLPQGTRFIPAHRVENNYTYFQPLEIVSIEPYTVSKTGINVTRFNINTPGRYQFDLIDEFGRRSRINFRVYIYDSSIIGPIFFSAIVPFSLLVYSFIGGKDESVE
jgi:hypothetical protein